MQGVLYVSHGTRLPEGRKEAVSFLIEIKGFVAVPLQEICFLEICSPSIEEGVKKLVAQGATKISVVPVLLLSATHDQKDIPLELQHIQKKYPTISFSYGRPLGVQRRLIDILEERIKELPEPITEETPILLVGRGSYVRRAQEDIKSIANQLEKRLQKKVDICFLAACKPSFNDVLADMKSSNQKTGIVLPYLWFNGLLIQSMKKKIKLYNEENEAHLQLCKHLGNHSNMKQAFLERTNESFDIPLIERVTNRGGG